MWCGVEGEGEGRGDSPALPTSCREGLQGAGRGYHMALALHALTCNGRCQLHQITCAATGWYPLVQVRQCMHACMRAVTPSTSGPRPHPPPPATAVGPRSSRPLSARRPARAPLQLRGAASGPRPPGGGLGCRRRRQRRPWPCINYGGGASMHATAAPNLQAGNRAGAKAIDHTRMGYGTTEPAPGNKAVAVGMADAR